jgi:hypothetical protein
MEWFGASSGGWQPPAAIGGLPVGLSPSSLHLRVSHCVGVFPVGKMYAPFPPSLLDLPRDLRSLEAAGGDDQSAGSFAPSGTISHGARGSVRRGGLLRMIAPAGSHSACGAAWWMRRDSAKCPGISQEREKHSYNH